MKNPPDIHRMLKIKLRDRTLFSSPCLAPKYSHSHYSSLKLSSYFRSYSWSIARFKPPSSQAESPKNLLPERLTKIRTQLIDFEKNLYSRGSNSLPFNVFRHVLDYPSISPQDKWEVEQLWASFEGDYDLENLVSELEKWIDVGKLREFWFVSVRISLTSVSLFRDIFAAVKKLCESHGDKYFNDDFYDSTIGYLLLEDKCVLAETVHSVIFPTIKPLSVSTLVKCCCLDAYDVGSSDSFERRYLTLSRISKSMSGADGVGVYDALMKFLMSRFLYIEIEQGKKNDQTTQFALFLFDIHLRFIKNHDLPSESDTMVRLTEYLVRQLRQNPACYTKQNIKEYTSSSIKPIVDKLRKNFYLYVNDAELQALLKDKWSFNYVKLLVEFCFYSGPQGPKPQNGIPRLLEVIPQSFSRDNSHLWSFIYKLCAITDTKVMNYNMANKLFINHCMGRPLTNEEVNSSEVRQSIVCEYILSHPKLSRCLEFQLEKDKTLMKSLQGHFNGIETELPHNGTAVSPKIFGKYVESVCEKSGFNKALDIVSSLVAANIDDELDLHIEEACLAILYQSKQSFFKGFTPFDLSRYHRQPWASFKSEEPLSHVKELSKLLGKGHFDLENHPRVLNRMACVMLSLNEYEKGIAMVKLLTKKYNTVAPETLIVLAKAVFRAVTSNTKTDHVHHRILYELMMETLRSSKNVSQISPHQWEYILCSGFLVVKSFAEAENLYFWALNRILYQIAYENKTWLKLSDDNEKVLMKINGDGAINQRESFENLLDKANLELKTAELKGFETNHGFNLSSVLLNKFYMTVQRITTLKLISRIVNNGLEKCPQRPFVGLELIYWLNKNGLINKDVLSSSKEKLMEGISKAIGNVYMVNVDVLNSRWKIAKARHFAFNEFQAQQEYLAFTDGGKITESYHVYSVEEVIENFQRLIEDIYDGV